MKIDASTTPRGFDCFLRKSSLSTENAVWLVLNDAEVKELVYGEPVTVTKDNYLLVSSRHLVQEQVKELLPYLICFVETGELFLEKEVE